MLVTWMLLFMYHITVPRVVGLNSRVVWMTIPVKISHTRYFPARRKHRAMSAADANIVVRIPDHRATCSRVEQQIVRLIVPIEIPNSSYTPPGRNSRTRCGADMNVVAHIPNSPSASTFTSTTRPVRAYHFCSDGILSVVAVNSTSGPSPSQA